MALVTLVSLSSLKGWDQNYRTGDIPAIAASLREFGFVGVLKVRDGVVMAGNQTLAALRSMKDAGEEPPAFVVKRGKDWAVPTVFLSHLSEEQAKAFAIADNRTHDLGKDDHERLAALLSDLSVDLRPSTGYSEVDLSELLESLAVPSPTGIEYPNQGQLDTEPGIITCPSCGETFKP